MKYVNNPGVGLRKSNRNVQRASSRNLFTMARGLQIVMLDAKERNNSTGSGNDSIRDFETGLARDELQYNSIHRLMRRMSECVRMWYVSKL